MGGNVQVNSKGTLGVNAAANLTGASQIATINTGGVLSIDTNFNANSMIDPASVGVVAIDASTNSALTGVNGSSAFLGSVGSKTFSGTTLNPGAGNTYNLGGGLSTPKLTISTANALTGASNSVVVGSSQTNGSGTVIFTAAENYGGGTSVNAGELQLTTGSISSGSTSTSNININSGGTLGINAAGNITGTAGTAIINSGGMLQIETDYGNANSVIDPSSVGIVALKVNNTDLSGVNGSNAYVGATANVSLSTANFAPGAGNTYRFGGGGIANTLTIGSGVIPASSTAAVVIGSGQANGAGTVAFTSAETYTGGTTINAGKLSIAAAGSILATGGININNGGTLGLNASGNIAGNGTPTVIVNAGGILSIDASFSGEGSVIDPSSNGIVAINTSSDPNLTGVNGSSAFIGVLGGNTNSFSLTATSLTSGAGNAYRFAGLGSGATAGALTISNGVLTDAGGVGATLIIGSAQTTTSGTVVLAAANSFTGGTTINSGTLQLNVQGAWGSGNIGDYDTLAFANTAGITFSQIISGTGSLNQTGAGTTTLSSVNTLSGTTTISAGAIQLGVSNALGNSTISIGVTNGLKFSSTIGAFTIASLSGASNEALTDTASQPVALTIAGTGLTNTYSGNLTGAAGASLIINAAGATQILSGSGNTYSGGTIIANGTLQIGATTKAGSLPTSGTVTDNAALTFNSTATTLTVSIPIIGSGTVTQVGAGTTTLTAAETYTGGTTISAGILQIGTGGSLATAGGITNNGTLAFNNSNGLTVAAAISGTGAVTQSAGTTILTAADSYTGGTTISAGALQIGDGTANDGSVTGAITDNASLVIANPIDQSVGNTISGTGSLTKTGAGNATLTAANSFTGPTTINQGTLSISADNNLGTVSTPTVGQLTLNGGTLKTTGSFALSANRGLNVGSNGGTINTDPVMIQNTLTIPGQTNFATDAHLNIAANSYVKFTNTANAASVGTNATVTVASGSTLELAGTASALSDGTAMHSVNVVNNSAAPVGGLLDSSTSPQVVGAITGTGNTVVGNGASLSANSIIQNSLVIGSGSTFTLAPSDSNGNPLAEVSASLGGVASGSLLSGSTTSGSGFVALSGSGALLAGVDSAAATPTLGLGGAAGGVSAVPEPSSILLAMFAALGLTVAIRRRAGASK